MVDVNGGSGVAGPGDAGARAGSLPDTVEWRDAADVGSDASRALWADAARTMLVDTAGHYRSVITYKDLAEGVQVRTRIRTKQLRHYWIGDVLVRVADDCATRGEPNLSSLSVNAAGSVGDGYLKAAHQTAGAPTDADDHAARARLECYRHFGAADLPDDGGAPALTAKLAASRTRTRKAAQETRPVLTCPTCHLALPATGECDNCA